MKTALSVLFILVACSDKMVEPSAEVGTVR